MTQEAAFACGGVESLAERGHSLPVVKTSHKELK